MKKIYLLLLIACLVHSCLPQKKTRENLEKEGDLTKEEIIVSDSCLSMPAFTYKLNDYMFVDTTGYALKMRGLWFMTEKDDCWRRLQELLK